MNITFVLPGSSRVPVGGYKVVFEYANRLSHRGHSITVVHPASLHPEAGLTERLYHGGRYLLWGATGRFGPSKWFRVLPDVKLTWVYSLNEANLPHGDAIVATGWPTAEFVARYQPDKGRKFYLLQHYEKWWGPEPRVRATWKLPLHKIVIACWLREIAHELGETATYIPNGLDFNAFGCDRPIEERKPHVLMLSHPMEWKGTADGLQALESARLAIPGLAATLFGVSAPPPGLPDWVNYVQNPPQSRLRDLYNQSSVFLAPSWAEGWPLPPAEAMMSGSALVCTNIGGHLEYAEHGRNALLAPPHSPEELADSLIRMLTDHSLRHQLAEQALLDIRRFTWGCATDRLEAVLSLPQEYFEEMHSK